MSQLVTFNFDPMRVPAIANYFKNIRDVAKQYADAYSPDSGDSVAEYVHRASYDVYAPILGKNVNAARMEFRRLVRAFIRGRRRTNQ
jgi:hypothetical protein